jgi:SAM-dependent methyltransferase
MRTKLCFELSRRLMPPPAKRTIDYSAYDSWRTDSLSKSWSAFSDSDVTGRDVLDFGCGDGQLSLFLATKKPRRILGVDINPAAIARARAAADTDVEFRLGSKDRMPVLDQSIDTIVAFDCLEHVMSPLPIFQDWYRVLRPRGKCLIEWFPFKGPWGPHMESLIPIPWAHVLFGERAMFRAAEAIYDLPEFTPRHWDIDEQGRKKPNKWRAWSSFKEQGYINEMDEAEFRGLVAGSGLKVTRFDKHSFSGSAVRRAIGRGLMQIPVIGEYFLSYAAIELTRPQSHTPPAHPRS